MTQIQTTKLTLGVLVGSDDDEAAVGKLNMYVLLVPGSDSGDDGRVRQARVYSQIIRRR